MTQSDRMQYLRENTTICEAPFSGISLRAHYDGRPEIRYSCCCNLDATNIESTNQKKFFDVLRSDIKQGRKNVACKKCHDIERTGAISERMRYLLSYNENEFNDLLDRWEKDTFEVKIKFSNRCPLACRSCHGNESSTYAMITRDRSIPDTLQSDFIGNNNYFKIIQETILDIAFRYRYPVLHLIGGEPLVIDSSLELMDWMIQQNLAQTFELRLTTSWAVNLSDNFLEKLKSFRQITFCLSIDSVGSNYHYVRWPGKFTKIESNLTQLIDILPNLPPVCIVLVPVFSLNNIFYIDEYIDYFYNWMKNIQYPTFLVNQHLSDPTYLQIEILPDSYRPILRDILLNCINHPLLCDSRYFVFAEFLKNTIYQLENNPGNEFEFQQYLKYTAEFDVRTQTRAEDFNSRLYNHLLPHHRNIYLDHVPKVDKNKFIGMSIL